MTATQTKFRLPWKKRIFLHPAFQSFATWAIACLIKFSWLTFRLDRQIHPSTAPYMQGDAPCIFCFWHGRMIIFPSTKPKNRPMHVLISHHRDGELIAKVISHFGIHSVRGSSNRGAREAVRSLIKLLARGDNISITPDGPRGPLYVAQEGAVVLARLAKVPIVPVSYSASSCFRLRSWDRFMIPHPFARVTLIVDAPIQAQGEIETLNAQLESALRRITADADRQMGQAA